MSITLLSTPTCLRVLTLGIGGTPPGDWANFSCDESAWQESVDHTAVNPDAPLGSTGAVWCGAEAYLADLPAPGGQLWVARYHFVLPPGAISGAVLDISPNDSVVAAFLNGIGLTATSGINAGHHVLTYAFGGGDFHQEGDAFGGQNVLALQMTNLAADPTPGPSSLAFRLTIDQPVPDGWDQTTGGSGVADTGAYGTLLGSESSGHPALRVKHATGEVDWEHDSVLFRVRSGGLTVLQTPFPTLAQAPAALLGRDPGSGLPMWTQASYATQAQLEGAVPTPPPVSTHYATPDQTQTGTTDAADPVPTPPDPERACGAAEGMATLLVGIYDGAVQIANSAKSRILDNFSNGLKRKLTAQLISLMTEAEFLQFEIDLAQIAFDLILQLAETIIDSATSLPKIAPAVPRLYAGDDRYYKIRCTAFQALWLRGGDYLAQAYSSSGLGTKDYWLTYLKPEWSFFAGSTIPGVNEDNPPWQLRWLEQIIEAVPDGAWRRAASVGALVSSEYCASCPGYPDG